MKTAAITRNILFALSIGALATACSSDPTDDQGGGHTPEPGNAYLTIVGDQNVFLENSWQQTITVRYHDGADRPLAGQVDFSIVGTADGGAVSAPAGVTNADGQVSVQVIAGDEGEAFFKVRAEAEYADAVEWTIAVSAGQAPVPPLDPTGRYQVNSRFDLVSGVPGTVGTVINTFLDMTDGPYDPATWLIDTILDEINNGTITSAVNAFRPALDAIVNDLLISFAPGIVTDILDIGDMLGQVARNFGTVSTLEVEAGFGIEGDELSATHTMTGVFFDINNQRYSFPLSALGMDYLVAEDVAFRLEGETRVHIGAHEFPLSYGSLLLVALDEVIVPLIDPYASDLYDLFENMIDCQAVGQQLADSIGVGSPSLYEGACILGVGAAVGVIYDQLASLDASAMLLGISGEARPQDTNTDRKVDVLTGGEWVGSVSYAGVPATLTDSTFRAERMALP
jgi:hypothetical protein